jgi:hypothetical protein
MTYDHQAQTVGTAAQLGHAKLSAAISAVLRLIGRVQGEVYEPIRHLYAFVFIGRYGINLIVKDDENLKAVNLNECGRHDDGGRCG